MTVDPSEPEGRTALVTGGPLAPDAALAGSDSIPPFLPVRMLNEFTYCARLGYLEWVQGEFTDNDDTVEGRYHHRNVDRTRQRSRRSEDGDDEVQKIHERSVWLGSEALGLSAKIDLLEREGRRVTPIDYKRGKRPHVPRGAYEPELVQLCAQGLLLRDHGYECDEGVLFFLASRERVRVVFDDELVARTTQLAAEMRAAAAAGQIPPPLVDSPKCPRCSLSFRSSASGGFRSPTCRVGVGSTASPMGCLTRTSSFDGASTRRPPTQKNASRSLGASCRRRSPTAAPF